MVPLTIIASFNRDVAIPLEPSIEYGFLAQLVEQLTLNHQVEGSNPSEPTSYVIKTAEMPFFCYILLSSPLINYIDPA